MATRKLNLNAKLAMAVAQLAERSLPTPEIEKTKTKEKRCWEWPIKKLKPQSIRLG